MLVLVERGDANASNARETTGLSFAGSSASKHRQPDDGRCHPLSVARLHILCVRFEVERQGGGETEGMAHRYGDLVTVRLSEQRVPSAFEWRGRRYWVDVIANWHLRDRWWAPEGHSDRHYFRVMTGNFEVFELYWDAAKALWVLDRCLD